MPKTLPSEPAFNSYWQLNDYGYSEVEAEFSHPDSPPDDPNRTSEPEAQRLARGCLDYDTCSREELWSFVKSRKLEKKAGRPAAFLLRRADRNQKFTKFTELPPELRNRVYEYYVDDFPELLKCPAQPPLARTCRQMRHEVLPVFYNRKRFEINYIMRDCGPGWFPKYCKRLQTAVDTLQFLRSLPPGGMSNLRHLRVDVRNNGLRDTWSAFGYFSIDVDLQNPNSLERVRIEKVNYFVSNWLKRTVANDVPQEIRKVVDEADEVNGRKIFNFKTFYALYKAVEYTTVTEEL